MHQERLRWKNEVFLLLRSQSDEANGVKIKFFPIILSNILGW